MDNEIKNITIKIHHFKDPMIDIGSDEIGFIYSSPWNSHHGLQANFEYDFWKTVPAGTSPFDPIADWEETTGGKFIRTRNTKEMTLEEITKLYSLTDKEIDSIKKIIESKPAIDGETFKLKMNKTDFAPDLNWPKLGDNKVNIKMESPIPYKKKNVIVLSPSGSTAKILKVYDWNLLKRFLKWTGIKKDWFIGIKVEII